MFHRTDANSHMAWRYTVTCWSFSGSAATEAGVGTPAIMCQWDNVCTVWRCCRTENRTGVRCGVKKKGFYRFPLFLNTASERERLTPISGATQFCGCCYGNNRRMVTRLQRCVVVSTSCSSSDGKVCSLLPVLKLNIREWINRHSLVQTCRWGSDPLWCLIVGLKSFLF